MSDISEAQRLCGILLHGWFERVEHQIVVGDDVETRVKHVKLPGLLEQLETHSLEAPRSDDRNTGGSNPNKAGSRPPGSLAHLDLIARLVAELHHAVNAGKGLLGHNEKRVAPFAAIHCPHCQGALVPDAEGTIRCTQCRYEYTRDEWLGLLP